ncbi:MAG: hypothetical protein LBT27_00860 [Prevotellaceae bacterium]|jgi:hypothetical protein|nr:hypothetical protein [Prevotellaceae bacterium]
MYLASKSFENLTIENIEQLKMLGYRGDINEIIAQLKFESISLQSKENELKKITSKQSGTIKETDFTEWIVAVSKYMGYRIDKKTTFLSEFLEMAKQMNKEIEVKNKKLKK